MANTTVSTASTTYLNKTYYDRNLLENAKTKFCHAEYGQKRSIPKNNGKKVEFRKWTPFDPKLVLPGLTEGVAPASQNLAQTNVEATVKQYGAVVEVSDLLKTTSYDDVMEGSTDMLGEQVGTAIEWITRDEMASGTNVQYAGGKTSRVALTSDETLDFAEIRKAVRTLKKAKAKKFSREGGKEHFIAIVSPDVVYDLQGCDDWEKVSDYSNREAIYSGEIGRMYGVVFVESTEAKVFKQSVCTSVNGAVSSAADVVLDLGDAPSDECIAYLSKAGNKLMIGTSEVTISSFNAATKTVTLSASGSFADDAIVYSKDAGACDATTGAGLDVHATLVFGKDAYGIIDIEGSGAIQTIIKKPGSAGTADPLDQLCTVGAKVMAYTAKMLNNDWLVRIESTVSA